MKTLRFGPLLLLLCFGFTLHAQTSCPPGLPPATICLAGQDAHGAFYLIAVPAAYNGELVLWNHGYSITPPAPLGTADLAPGAPVLLELGFAVAASSYRPDAIGLGGWAVRDGAEDTENLRQLFVQTVGRPQRTFLVGASEGGLITEEMVERFGRDEHSVRRYDGALSACGVVAGATRLWQADFDQRVVYQYYCQNLPRPDEEQYPLYFGLAPDNTLTADDVGARINECTGVAQPPETRTPQQAQNLANLVGVLRISEGDLLAQLAGDAFGMQEIALVRTHGLNPFTNAGAHYSGSSDDRALNRGVYRAAADPAAARFLRKAYDPDGDIDLPMVTIHTTGDPTVFVEEENAFRHTVKDAGRLHNLQQNYTDAAEHCEFSFSEELAAFQALIGWVETHSKPTREDVAGLCQQNMLLFADTCNFDLIFHPKPLGTRVPERR
jgi:hypothetical protein